MSFKDGKIFELLTNKKLISYKKNKNAIPKKVKIKYNIFLFAELFINYLII